MYLRILVNFCGVPETREYRSFIVRFGEIAIQISYAYMSSVDEAYTKCWIVAQDSQHILGTIGVGKVVAVGVGVDSVREGDRVAAITFSSSAQSITTASSSAIHVFNSSNYTDLDLVFIASLSIQRQLLELIKGVHVLIVGKDLSIIPFALAAQQYAAKLYIIPKYTLWPDIVKGEHVSLFEDKPVSDVAVIATYDPAVVSAIPRLVKEDATLILHPLIKKVSTLTSSAPSSFNIKTMRFGDLAVGEAMYEKLKDVIVSRVPVVKPGVFIEKPRFPSIISFIAKDVEEPSS